MKKFTLVELVIVLGVCCIACALLLSAADNARDDAKSALCQNSLKETGAMLHAYTGDNGGLLPAGHTSANDAYLRWGNAVYPYFKRKNKGFPVCPAAGNAKRSFGANYCYNREKNTRLPFYYYSSEMPENSKLQRYAALSPEILLIADGNNDFLVSPLQNGCTPVRDVSGNGVKDSCRAANFNHYEPLRHNGSLNYLAGDLSVKNLLFADWEDNLNNSGIIYDAEFSL